MSGDGCSEDCKIEEGFECSGGSLTSPDYCVDATPLDFTMTVVPRNPYKFYLEFNKDLSQDSISLLDSAEGVFSVQMTRLNTS